MFVMLLVSHASSLRRRTAHACLSSVHFRVFVLVCERMFFQSFINFSYYITMSNLGNHSLALLSPFFRKICMLCFMCYVFIKAESERAKRRRSVFRLEQLIQLLKANFYENFLLKIFQFPLLRHFVKADF